MTPQPLQCFIRGSTLYVEMFEADELGRQVGGIVTVESPVLPALRIALDAQIATSIAAQSTVITEAKAIKQADPNAEVNLVADLKPAAADPVTPDQVKP